MMRIALKVKFEDGREQAVMVSAPDLIAFERQYDKPTSAVAGGRIEYLWWVAWHAMKRLTLTSLDFDAWVLTVGEITDDVDAGKELPPLGSSQPIG